jgi:DNA-binding CsgD family transcriptional regulator
VATLTRSEIEALLRFVHHASTDERDVAVTPEIVQGLCELVPSAEHVGYAELDWKRRRARYFADGLGAQMNLGGDDTYWRLYRQHAVCEYFARTGDLRTRRMSDLIRPREWRTRELYAEYYRPLQYEIDLRIPAPAGLTKTFMFRSSRRDFTERDRLVLELLRPHLGAIDATYESRRKFAIDVPLTQREREILGWVEAGKTNAEIAQILWISPLTVRKHLENAYEKLGVRTRTAAVARLRSGAQHGAPGTGDEAGIQQ